MNAEEVESLLCFIKTISAVKFIDSPIGGEI